MRRHLRICALATTGVLALASCPALAQDSAASSRTTNEPAPPIQTQPGPATSALPAQSSSSAAHATDANGIGDIVVTANKRSQSVNNVGLSITAATGEELARVGVRDTGDLVKITPGLTFTKSQDGTPVFTLRGVGFNDYTLGASPAVSVYVDQVPMAFSVFTQGATLDLQRVEVLKGPQGLLFGQNSTGGAINYIANKPSQTTEAGGSISYSRFNTFDGMAFVSGPVTDTLSLRVAGATTQSGPWQYSVTRNAKLGAQNFIQGRVQALWEPTRNVSLLLSVNGWYNGGDTQAAQLVGTDLQATSSVTNPGVVAARAAAFLNYPRSTGNARQADWDSDRELDHDDRFIQTSLRADVKLSSSLTFTSVSAYSHYNENFAVDRDGTNLKNAGVDDVGTVDSYYQELRLSGDTSRLNWILGANYAQNKVYSANDILTGDSTNTAILPNVFIQRSVTTITQDERDYAFFGNAEFKLTSALTLLGGVRYTNSKDNYSACLRGDQASQITFPFFSQILGGQGIIPINDNTCLNLNGTTFRTIVTPYTSSLNQTNVSWRGGVNFKPTRNLLLYGLASRGYKSGSFPTVPASTTAQFAPVTQESVTAYEAGFKLTALTGHLQINGAGFHYDYANKQVRGIILDPIFNQLELLVNIPKSQINGGEIEVIYQPFTGLTLHSGATYIDSKITNFNGLNNNRIVGNYNGSPLPFSPKWNVVGAADYSWALSDRLNAYVGGNLLYNSHANSTLVVGPQSLPGLSSIRAFTTVDARAGVRFMRDKLDLSVWGRNIFNTYYWTNQFVTQDVDVRYAARPVTYGVTLKFNY